MNDWYKILGTARDADEAQIKAAYRKLAKKYHPDAHPGDKECEARFPGDNGGIYNPLRPGKTKEI